MIALNARWMNQLHCIYIIQVLYKLTVVPESLRPTHAENTTWHTTRAIRRIIYCTCVTDVALEQILHTCGSHVIAYRVGKCFEMYTCTQTRTHHSGSFQLCNQQVDFPCGHCARGMIPPLGILIGFWWLPWVVGHLPNHLTLMTWLDMLLDSIEFTSEDMLQQPVMCSFPHRAAAS